MNKKLTVDQVRKCVLVVYYEGYNDGYLNRGCHFEETDWQAITDELNSQIAIVSEAYKTLKDTWIYGYYSLLEENTELREMVGELKIERDSIQAQVDKLSDEYYRYRLQCKAYEEMIAELKGNEKC